MGKGIIQHLHPTKRGGGVCNIACALLQNCFEMAHASPSPGVEAVPCIADMSTSIGCRREVAKHTYGQHCILKRFCSRSKSLSYAVVAQTAGGTESAQVVVTLAGGMPHMWGVERLHACT